MNHTKPISRRECIYHLFGCLLLASSFSLKKRNKYSLESLMGIKTTNMIKKQDFILQNEAAEAFIQMRNEAKKDGIEIKVISSFRDYNHQKRIWNTKFKNYTKKGLSAEQAIKNIILYSTIPGTSRHHWGTDLDIIQANVDNKKYSSADPLREEYFAKGAVFYPLKLWLNQNSEKFGFHEVYTNSKQRTGFNYEPWHFSYKPLSSIMLKDFLSYNLENELLKFPIEGSFALNPQIIKYYINNYVLGINNKLL